MREIFLFSAADGLLEMSLLLEGSAGEHAGELIKQGWPQLVTWQGEWVAHVPCHTLLETSYRVTLPTMDCECPCLTLAGPCVHLCLVSTLAQLRQGPSPQQERQRLAEEALQEGNYLIDEGCCITFHSGVVCVTEVGNGGGGDGGVCTCVAATLGTPCVGVLLLGLAGEAGDTGYTHQPLISPTPPTLDQPPTLPTLIKTELPTQSIPVASQESPIIIQTTTGLPVPRRPQTPPETIEEGPDPPLSSKALIEKLHHWASSEDFTDSDILHSILQAAHDAVWGSPAPPTPPSPPRPSPAEHQARSGSRKLRAVVRPVRRKETVVKEEEVEQEEEEGYPWAPPTKVTRSGRTVRSKEEPDFVT